MDKEYVYIVLEETALTENQFEIFSEIHMVTKDKNKADYAFASVVQDTKNFFKEYIMDFHNLNSVTIATNDDYSDRSTISIQRLEVK